MELKSGYKQTELGVLPDDWYVTSLDQLADIDSDNLGVDTRPDYEFNYISLEDVDNGRLRGYSHQVYTSAPLRARRRLRLDDVLISTVRPNLKSHLLFRSLQGEWICSTGFSVIRCNRVRVVPSYILLHLFATVVSTQIESLLAGSNYPAINGKDVKALRFPLPPTLAEQEAIAEALSDADALVESLEQLIAKKRLIKQGAMQELLTGRRRLPGFTVKPGYKQTEIGLVPEDWIIKYLGNSCAEITTGKLDANAMKPDGEYRFYTCAKDFYLIDEYAFDTEALLVSGNGANVGYIHYFKGKFNAYQRTYVLSEFSESVEYLQHYMGQKLSDRIRVDVKAGNTPYITMSTLTEMKIALPSIKHEQLGIASILSDMGAEIATLEEKLTKARLVKQGMMQELLTGRIRLV